MPTPFFGTNARLLKAATPFFGSKEGVRFFVLRAANGLDSLVQFYFTWSAVFVGREGIWNFGGAWDGVFLVFFA